MYNVMEVLPMASDVLTVISFVIFLIMKIVPVISQMFGCVCLIEYEYNLPTIPAPLNHQ